jgi:hypothetical protein
MRLFIHTRVFNIYFKVSVQFEFFVVEMINLELVLSTTVIICWRSLYAMRNI